MRPNLIIYSEFAREEIDRIYNWYEDEQSGLGLKFFGALEQAEKHMNKSPRGFKSGYSGTREIIITPFPYHLIYTVEGRIVYVHAIFPSKSKPSKKYRSVKKGRNNTSSR